MNRDIIVVINPGMPSKVSPECLGIWRSWQHSSGNKIGQRY
jgi:hypothetical protein